ncbi:Gibberellin 3-beta-dioxygenase 2 [Euphorbia peplus]|nr:Gibberellin 3-beta-dioxygenase 2 [Euphorbia peplus]
MSQVPLKENPIFLDQIVPIDFKNIQKLPNSHKWTNFNSNSSSNNFNIPIISLTHPNAPYLIKQASESWGMFQLINHGIPFNLLHLIQHHTQNLFSLPSDQKLLTARSPDGLSGYGVPRISNFFPKQMWHEGFTIVGSPEQHATQLWPNHHASFCKVTDEYKREMKGVSEKIVGMMFKSMGLSLEDTKWFRPNEESSDGVLQLNSYPKCPDPERAMGLAPHTDSSLLTLLYQNDANGLQVLREGIGWVRVYPMRDALVVTIGDLMQIISNGRFKSAQHQALVSSTRHRISTAYFYGPPKNVMISAPLKLIDLEHPLMYRHVSWKEYLDTKAIHFNNTLDFLKFDVI